MRLLDIPCRSGSRANATSHVPPSARTGPSSATSQPMADLVYATCRLMGCARLRDVPLLSSALTTSLASPGSGSRPATATFLLRSSPCLTHVGSTYRPRPPAVHAPSRRHDMPRRAFTHIASCQHDKSSRASPSHASVTATSPSKSCQCASTRLANPCPARSRYDKPFSRRDRSCPNDAPGRVEFVHSPTDWPIRYGSRPVIPPRHASSYRVGSLLHLPRPCDFPGPPGTVPVESTRATSTRLIVPGQCLQRVSPLLYDWPLQFRPTRLGPAQARTTCLTAAGLLTTDRHAPSALVLRRSYLALNDNPFRTVTTGLGRACSTLAPSGQAPTTCQVTPLPARRLIFSRQRRIMPSPNDWSSRDKSCRDVPIRQDWSRHSSPGRARAVPIPSCPTDLLRTITRRV
jgi:hypothetical protein